VSQEGELRNSKLTCEILSVWSFTLLSLSQINIKFLQRRRNHGFGWPALLVTFVTWCGKNGTEVSSVLGPCHCP
jgi:hypothetical protein